MSENSAHHHHHSKESEYNHIFRIGIGLNLLFVFIEVYFGIIHNSLALVSDGIHNLMDVVGLTISWLGFLFSKRAATKKFSIYAAFINTSLLMLTSFWIIFEAYHRYLAKEEPVAVTIILVAMVGFFINFFTARLFHKDHHHDLNMQSAYLHLMADAGISLGVVVTGIIIYFKAVYWVDPLISAVISVIIIAGTWKYFKEAVRMMMGKPPASINFEEVKNNILSHNEIKSVNDMKIWSLSTSENALSADIHVTAKLSDSQLKHIQHHLFHEFKMTSVELNQIVRSE